MRASSIDQLNRTLELSQRAVRIARENPKPASSSGGSSVGCACTDCVDLAFLDVDFGGNMPAMSNYDVTWGIGGLVTQHLVYMGTNGDGDAYWQSDSFDFTCGPYDIRPTMLEMVVTSCDQQGVTLTWYDTTDGDTDPDRKPIQQWKNFRTGWFPNCTVELGGIPQPILDPVCDELETLCIVCLKPSVQGGCNCGGDDYVWIVDFGSVTPAGACTAAGAPPAGVQVLPYKTTTTDTGDYRCIWEKVAPDGWTYGIQARQETVSGNHNLSTLRAYAMPPGQTNEAFGVCYRWGYNTTGSPYRFCEHDSYTLAGVSSFCGTPGTSITAEPVAAP